MNLYQDGWVHDWSIIYCRTYLIGRGVIPTHSIWVNLQCHLACSENTGHDASCRYVIDSCALKSVICFSDAGKNVKFWIKTRSRNSNFLASKHGSGFRIYINLYWNRYKDIKLELIVEGFFFSFFLFICIKLCNCMFNLIFNVIRVPMRDLPAWLHFISSMLSPSTWKTHFPGIPTLLVRVRLMTASVWAPGIE